MRKIVLTLIIVTVSISTLGSCSSDKDQKNTNRSNTKQSSKENNASSQDSQSQEKLIWQQSQDGWIATAKAPDCPKQPMLISPVDLKLATSVLYPGQTRGQYKPHGGFRFDNSDNYDISVKAPIDGFVFRGSRYLVDGEIQYTFDIFNNCGVMTRLGHLRELTEKFQAIAETFSEALTDSRTSNVNPPVNVKAGETIATATGITAGKNTFVDWGVYDYRSQNEASKSSEYQNAHTMDKELSFNAVCWFDWLPTKDAKLVKSLPAGDGTAGKTSDYCK
ncbi:MAG: hypothetical protein U0R17_02465 [Acidimicrobiia bacterium]